MRVHFIAIGGSVMHNLALSLAEEGYRVSGSDDELQEPSRSRLAEKGLLPSTLGWHPQQISHELQAVIVGMHARADNPELVRAQELGLKIYSFPEFVFEQAQHKQRVVVAGSHGKTTITAMVMHVLLGMGLNFDYLVGAQLQGFPYTVRLSQQAPVIIIEGDEYLTSPLDTRPKFLIYQPHVVVLSGIAWDHVNVFPTETDYVQSFRQLLKGLQKAAMVVYNSEDEKVTELVWQHTTEELHYRYPYETPAYRIRGEQVEVKLDGKRGAIQLYGQHNLSNLAAAYHVCKLFAIEAEEFLQHMASFKGAALRLQPVYEDEQLLVIRDFAHSPSKVRATVGAVAERYKGANLIFCLELHTYSSLNKGFLGQYRGVFKKFEHKVILVNEHAAELKQLERLTPAEIRRSFNDPHLLVVGTRKALVAAITQSLKPRRNVVLLMSSGNLDNLSISELVQAS